MTSISRITFGCFCIASICNLIAGQAEWQLLEYFSKPFLLSSLALAFTGMQKKWTPFAQYLTAGFAFSWIGDVLLMLEPTKGEQFFVFGLLGFLIAHIFYIFAFYTHAYTKEKHYVLKSPAALIPFILFYLSIITWLWNDLGAMKIPVGVYSGIITTMGIFALNLRAVLPKRIFGVLITGVVLFILSDTMIAIGKFKFPLPYAHLSIMGTYILAQAAIFWVGLNITLDTNLVINSPNRD